MATNPAQPAVPPPTTDRLDDHTGVYGFFRRHQKKILYTAGLFTLLTFSITGPMLALIGELFGGGPAMSTILVNGQRVALTVEDYKFGDLIARNSAGALASVFPPIHPGEGGQSTLSSNIAILRRAAIAEGLDVSMDDVDRAIEVQREAEKVESAVQYARLRGFPSLADFREVVREAMRVGNYVRLQTLALDSSDALVLQKVLAEREKITLKVAVFDEKVVEERLKAAGGVSEEDLRAWVNAKTEQEKYRINAIDTNRHELLFGAALLADGQFDPAQWPDELKEFAPGDDELQQNYDREKEARFKTGDKEYKPFADVKAELVRLLQAEQVMNKLAQKVMERIREATKTQTETLQRDQQELADAERRVKELTQKAADPAADAAAKEELRQAEEVVPAKKAAVEASTAAVAAARATFDFAAAFTELTKDKSGFVLRAMKGRRNTEEMKDLDADGLGLGQWPLSSAAQGLQAKGDVSFAALRTTKAVILFQATDVELRPLKPWDKLKPLAEQAYFAEKAKAEGEAKKAVFEAAVLRLAKEKMPEKVAEIEGKKGERVDKRVADWEQATQQAIAAAEKTLAGLVAGTQAQIAWQKKLDALRAELGQKDAKRTAFDAEVGKEIEAEIAKEAKAHHGAVLDAAAAEAGFTVTEVGPHSRELSSRPRFDKAFDPTVVFLFRSHANLKLDESTGVVQDPTARRWYFAVCTKVEPLTVQDVTRRDFEMTRTGGTDGLFGFGTLQALACYGQAFTQEALEKRYDLQRPAGTQDAK